MPALPANSEPQSISPRSGLKTQDQLWGISDSDSTNWFSRIWTPNDCHCTGHHCRAPHALLGILGQGYHELLKLTSWKCTIHLWAFFTLHFFTTAKWSSSPKCLWSMHLDNRVSKFHRLWEFKGVQCPTSHFKLKWRQTRTKNTSVGFIQVASSGSSRSSSKSSGNLTWITFTFSWTPVNLNLQILHYI